MTEHKNTKRRALLIGLPVAAAILVGGAGAAYAADNSGGATPAPSGSTSSEQSDSGQHETADPKPSYTSSVTTTATESNGNEAAADLALTKLAKIDVAAAAQAGAQAVSGGSVTGVELKNEGGNVVYAVEVVTQTEQTEVIVDAGNGSVLAQTVEQADSN